MSTTHKLLCCDAVKFLGSHDMHKVTCTIMDPPDATGQSLNGYIEYSPKGYVAWLGNIIQQVIRQSDTTWISYNAKWDCPLKAYLWSQLARPVRGYHPTFLNGLELRTFIWSYTFGQNQRTDCGPGYRPILRIKGQDALVYPDQIKVPSWRQKHGDKRAAKGGKVPLDFWDDFPRVVGNSKERRKWHPTQHPEGLIERMVLLSTKSGDTVLDLFSGTGTVLRVCKRLGRSSISVEANPYFCKKIAEENGINYLGQRNIASVTLAT